MGNSESSSKEIKQPEIKVSELQTYIMVVQLKLTQVRNKKTVEIKKKKEEVVNYLKDNNTEMAKLKAEGILRNEDNILACDFLATLCELVKEKITYLLSFNTCPDDLRACLETLIYSSTRLEIDEFHKFRELIQRKYGEKFISEAVNNTSGLVNKNVEKQLSILPFNEKVIIAKLKEIAKEEKIEVDFPEDIIAPIQDFSNPFDNSGGNAYVNYGGSNFNQYGGSNFNQGYNQGENFNNTVDINANYPNFNNNANFGNFDNVNYPQMNINTNMNMNNQSPQQGQQGQQGGVVIIKKK